MKAYMSAYAIEYGTKPEYVMAVATIESRKGDREFREGLMGRTYFGPMGVHRCFLSKWEIDKTEVNIMVGARALRGIQSLDALKKRLRKYNTECNPSYLAAVTKAVRKYEKGW